MNDAAHYHSLREIEERKLASEARDDASRFSHLELADRHAEMARTLTAPELCAEHERAS